MAATAAWAAPLVLAPPVVPTVAPPPVKSEGCRNSARWSAPLRLHLSQALPHGSAHPSTRAHVCSRRTSTPRNLGRFVVSLTLCFCAGRKKSLPSGYAASQACELQGRHSPAPRLVCDDASSCLAGCLALGGGSSARCTRHGTTTQGGKRSFNMRMVPGVVSRTTWRRLRSCERQFPRFESTGWGRGRLIIIAVPVSRRVAAPSC